MDLVYFAQIFGNIDFSSKKIFDAEQFLLSIFEKNNNSLDCCRSHPCLKADCKLCLDLYRLHLYKRKQLKDHRRDIYYHGLVSDSCWILIYLLQKTIYLLGYIDFIMIHERSLTSNELIRSLSRNLAGESESKNPKLKNMNQTAFIEAYILGNKLMEYLKLCQGQRNI